MGTTAKASATDKLQSIESAAEFLGGLSPSTIRFWLSSGRLQRVKIGSRTFVYESDLAKLIKLEIVPADVSSPAKGRSVFAAPILETE